MNKFFLLVSVSFVTIVICHPIKSQEITHDGWEWVSPLPYGGILKSIEMIDDEKIIAGGYNGHGVILNSADGGTTWSQSVVPEGFDGTVNKIQFFSDKLTGYALGTNALYETSQLLITHDGGLTWEIDSSYINYKYWGSELNWVPLSSTIGWYLENYFLTPETGWVLDWRDCNVYKKTPDNTWEGISIENLNDLCTLAPDGIYFANESIGWILGGHNEWGTKITGVTIDGGNSWEIGDITFSDIVFINDSTGWAVDFLGKIYHTENEAESWDAIGILPDSLWITELSDNKSIHFADEQNGVYIEDRSLEPNIFKTMDGGLSWNLVSTPFLTSTSLSIKKFQMVTDNLWYTLLEDTIYKTIDGGENWTNVKIEQGADMHFFNENEGWIVTPYVLNHTFDGGNTFYTEKYLSSLTTQDILLNTSLIFFDNVDGMITTIHKQIEFKNHKAVLATDISIRNDTIYAVVPWGYPDDFLILYKSSTDTIWHRHVNYSMGNNDQSFINHPFYYSNRRTHTMMKDDYSSAYHDNGYDNVKIIANTRDEYIALHEDGNLGRNSEISSVQSGNTNEVIFNTIANNHSKDITVTDVSTIYVIGDNIFRSTNSGSTFDNLGGPGRTMNAIDFIDPTTGFISANDMEIYFTNDAGNFWSVSMRPESQFSGITNVFFTENRGYLTNSNELFTSQDGKNWSSVANFTTSDIDILFVTADNSTSFLKDFGQNLININNSTGEAKSVATGVEDFVFLDANEGWYVSNQQVFHSADGGTTWEAQNSFVDSEITSIHFADNQNGFVGGDLGKLFRTRNGGLSWENISVAGVRINTLHFVTEDIGFAGADNGTFFTTTDGGDVWISKSTGIAENIHSIRFFNPSEGYILVLEGYLYTQDGGESFTKFKSPILDTDQLVNVTPESYAHMRRTEIRYPVGHERKTPSLFILDPKNVNSFYAYDNNILTKGVILGNSDSNQTPIISDQTLNIAENSSVGTEVGTVTASDADNDMLTFSISEGNNMGGFALDAASGVLRVGDSNALDFETTPTFVLTVEVSDDSEVASASITINLTDVENEILGFDSQEDFLNSICIAPNPTTNIINISFSKKNNLVHIKVINLSGKQIHIPYVKVENTFQFDFSNEKNGLYTLIIALENYRNIYKLIKK